MDSENDKKALTESELIDRQVEEIMTDEDSADGSGKRKKKRRKKARSGEKPSLKERWKGYSRKRKIITVVVVLAAAAFLLSRCGRGEKGPVAVPVNVMSLTRQPIKEKLSVSGPISGTDSVDVVSNIHAEIITMNVKEGDKVTKDQILAVLDKTDLERDLQVAQNAYDLAVVNKQEKDKSEALGYEKATQDLRKAQADYNRNSALYAAGDISQVEMEQAANALNDAKRQVEGYNVVNGRGAADASYELQVQNAAIDLEKKKEELENAEIKSTIDGTVVRVNSKVGQFADKVEDDKPIFSIDGSYSKLIAGITAKAEILIRESEDAFVVPVTSLIDDGEATYIAVVEEQKVRRIPVTLGVDGDVNVEVIPADGSEFTEGMQVILNPGPMTVDGALVTVLPQM